jgi:hypothetical protein
MAGPIYYISPVSQVLSLLCSAMALRDIYQKRIASRNIRIILTLNQLWNFVVQITICYFYNFSISFQSASGAYLLTNLLIWGIMYVNTLILQCFKSLNERITDKGIGRFQWIVGIAWIVLHTPAFLRLVAPQLGVSSSVSVIYVVGITWGSHLCFVNDAIRQFPGILSYFTSL